MTSNSSTVLLAIVLFFSSISSFVTEAKNGGFTVDLIHRDSPKSPFYNPLIDHFQRKKNAFQRKKNAFQRSLMRANRFASQKLFPSDGEYLVKISYGTPQVDTLAIFDTGSSLCWIQCQPCTNCYLQKFPPFDPKNSSTYKLVRCKNQTCEEYSGTTCASSSNSCVYRVRYGDGSYSYGDLATETVTLSETNQGSASFPNFVFGCGHNNGGAWPYEGSGLVGFGSENVSFVKQLSSLIQGKFSYCLGPLTEESKPGKLNLGGVVSGDGVVSTPLYAGRYYILTLEAISVDETRLEYPRNSSVPPSNNIVIDSGTTGSYLEINFYQDFVSTVKERINSTKTVPDPQDFSSLCYTSLDGLKIPKITLHFKGADLKLENPINTFINTSESSVCLAFGPISGFNILGSVQQAYFWVGYNIVNKVLSFKPADCTAA